MPKLLFCIMSAKSILLTHCGLVTPYGDKDLGQYWLKLWLIAWWHQAIIWTNVDLLFAGTSDFNLRAILPDITHPSITKIGFKILFKSPWGPWVKISTTSPRGHWVNEIFCLRRSSYLAVTSKRLHFVFIFCTQLLLWIILYCVSCTPGWKGISHVK